jgi:hypothetical protein
MHFLFYENTCKAFKTITGIKYYSICKCIHVFVARIFRQIHYNTESDICCDLSDYLIFVSLRVCHHFICVFFTKNSSNVFVIALIPLKKCHGNVANFQNIYYNYKRFFSNKIKNDQNYINL